MNRFTGSVITQQMYTRERRGVYRATEGFDTVAKSESLDNNFVKKILHPFCLYDAPAELAARGEKNEEMYPPALHLFHTETNDTVIGQSRYLAADFTGQRSAFFAHNFVVPPIRSEEIVEGYGKWLHADFAGSYDGEPGGTLPELADMPVRQREGRLDPLYVLKALGFGEEAFKALLQAVMTSVAGKKKIYVALDVPVAELSQRAVELTEVIFSVLPYDFRRRLGVITYANEPKSRKYIHLTFVEKGSLRQGDRSIERDFIFDLATGRILNADFGEQRQPFADLAWKTLERKGSLEDFARFADSLLPGESTERKLSLALYNELAVFYEIEQGNESLYTGNKQAILSGLLSYLKPEGALVSRVRLNDMFLERFDREYDLIRSKGIPQAEIMESFKDYFVLKGHNYRVKIVDYFINGMLNCGSAGHEDALAAAYNIIESNDELSGAFFKRVLAQPIFRSKLLEPYLETRLATAAKTSDILLFVSHWGRFLPEALQLSFVRDAVRDYLLEKLQRDKDPVAAVAAIDEAVDKAEKERRRGGGTHPEALALLQELKVAGDRFLLNRLSLDELTQEQLLDISFLQYRDISDWQPPLDSISRQKANALRAAYRWFGEENPDEGIFAGLTPRELDDVQLLGRRWLKETQSIEPFERLPLAFYHSRDREGGPLDYDALLELVIRKAGNNKEMVYRFFAWSQGSSLFTVSNKKLHSGYRKAILKYFLNKDREAFKNRDFRKNHMSSAGPALQNVYNEARSKLASPLARWISRSRFQLLISGSILGLVLIGIIIAVSLLRPDNKDTALPAGSPSPAASASGGFAPAAVYLGGGGAAGAGSRLVFAFADAEECTAFDPAEITVTTSGNKTEVYDVTGIERDGCPVQSPEAGAAGNDGGEDAAATGAAAEGEGEGVAPENAAAESEGVAPENAAAEGEGVAPENAAAESEGVAPENAAAESEGVASENANAESEGVAPENATVANAGAAPYTVIVDLESGARLAVGDMIAAGEYKLSLQADPANVPTPTPTPAATGSDEDTEPSATASADTEAE